MRRSGRGHAERSAHDTPSTTRGTSLVAASPADPARPSAAPTLRGGPRAPPREAAVLVARTTVPLESDHADATPRRHLCSSGRWAASHVPRESRGGRSAVRNAPYETDKSRFLETRESSSAGRRQERARQQFSDPPRLGQNRKGIWRLRFFANIGLISQWLDDRRPEPLACAN